MNNNNNNNNNNFSITLRRLKEMHNLTNKQLASIADVAEVTIIKYLSGKRNPSREVIQKLSSYFNIPESELMNSTPDENISTILESYNNAVKSFEKIKGEIAKASFNEIPNFVNRLNEASKTVETAKETLKKILLESKPINYVPLYDNRIPAGYPNSVGTDNIADWVVTPSDYEVDFAVTIKGDSMIYAGIDDGDTVFVTSSATAEHGDMVIAATEEGEVTIKYFVQKGNQYFLMPANPDYKPIPFTDKFRIVGKVVAVLKEPRPYKVAGELNA
ncbi:MULTISPECIES: LexA family transcriptional regulator [Thermoanaerobacterium]|uniref:Phage repressor like transcriptional regulator n=2 Tax=Thermoanaerobacterium TaxID=28895 RepID=W9EEX2_9THEO|nr:MULTISPECIES: LexA family transcriptional regulator [Thermoanaerobacterium]AFK85224.1 phage repressor like transcriptional regulator, XRE family [Thermoanaerobacterium saccharolyticum JW/SL-YS485]ETO39796.1 phage repressor like transcriptional regulator [Thermoanaerobacterium aotearoense SCUT27]